MASCSEGFTKEDTENIKEIDAVILAKACERATATAYKAVMKPKEGTILTVAKGIFKESGRTCGDDGRFGSFHS